MYSALRGTSACDGSSVARCRTKQEHRRTGNRAREFCEFAYRTKKSWSRARRVVAKAEQIEGRENPRYLVTSLGKEAWPAQKLYERLYCARGEMENRIKEHRRAGARITARRIWVRYSCAYPWQNVFAAAWTALRC
jgi:hypothetical protein